MKILVTGAAGFIGMHTVHHLAQLGFDVVGIDNLNEYYSVDLKLARLNECGIRWSAHSLSVNSTSFDSYRFIKVDLNDRQNMLSLFEQEQFDYVIHLAAQAGVRYSLENPFVYAESNMTGFLTILEGCRHQRVKHLVYASSSSVYGLNGKIPFSENDPTEHPVSLYAATKKANEMMAHSYSHLYHLPTTGLRFFTVYGPWGRPDMALFLFTEAILNDKPIQLFNQGNMYRDFTYIEDLVPAIVRCLFKPPYENESWPTLSSPSATSSAPYRIFNVGSARKVKLIEYIEAIEVALDKKAIRTYTPQQPGDVIATFADTSELTNCIDYEAAFSVTEGVARFVDWYLAYHKKVII